VGAACVLLFLDIVASSKLVRCSLMARVLSRSLGLHILKRACVDARKGEYLRPESKAKKPLLERDA
jgi:hypothetical protein